MGINSKALYCGFALAIVASVQAYQSQTDARTEQNSEYKVVGYYTNWAQYRAAPATFLPEQIKGSLYTHLIYAFARVEDVTFKVMPFQWNDILPTGDGMYKRFHNTVRNQNPAIKTLIAIGGSVFSQETKVFSNAVATPESRKLFAQNMIEYARANEFDGIDINWEFPVLEEREKFTALLNITRFLIGDESYATGRPGLLLTMAAFAGHTTIHDKYETKEVEKFVNWIGVMTYDLYGSWAKETRGHTALYPLDYQDPEELSVSKSMITWMQDVPAKKLLMGIASYGQAFQLANTITEFDKTCNVLASTVDPPPAGIYTKDSGRFAYYEIMELLKNGGQMCTDRSQGMQSVMRYNTSWIGFDTVETIMFKLDYIKALGLGGSMLWAIDLEDFTGQFPISNAVANVLTYNITLKPKSPSQPPPPAPAPVLVPVTPEAPVAAPVEPPPADHQNAPISVP